ncbi:MAG: SDR family NAD(P)-dependent oxidoreductase [Pseudomonadota bacterium]
MTYKRALIIGAGAGLSASLARKFKASGATVDLASRSTEDLADLAAETGATVHTCDAMWAEDIAAVFEAMESVGGAPDVVVYNPSARVPGPIEEIDGDAVERAVSITALGAFHTAQNAAQRMIPAGRGAILFTGASAGVKGFPRSAAFAMGKFALRGLAQSLARELHPKGVHIGHFVIDGGIRNPARPERMDPADAPDSMLCPDAIAGEYMSHLAQDRSCWSWEVELRPWVERF